MKPIIRWNVGRVSYVGLDCLLRSVLNTKKLYGDAVDLFVCFNTELFRSAVLNDIEREGVTLVKADDFIAEWLSDDGVMMTTGDQKSGWVFAPLQNDSHRKELIFDNDILIFRRNPIVEEWLFSDDDRWFFMHHWRYATRASEIKRREICFGALCGVVPAYVPRIDGGMVGVPSGDRMPVVEEVLKKYDLTSDDFVDHVWEQAVLSLVYDHVKDTAVLAPFKLIPRAFKPDFEIFDETFAVHLSGLNQLRGKTWSLQKYREFIDPYVL